MKNKGLLYEILSPIQQRYINAFRWLVSDKRLEGRSYLLAICFIEKALNNRDMTIEVWDHFQGDYRTENIMSIVRRILSKYPEIENYCTFARDWFRISKDVKKVNK